MKIIILPDGVPMKIPFHLIESFLNVVESESLESAARKLDLTQSALSRQMKQLEGLLPYKIFEMSGRSKKLTKYGNLLYKLLKPKFNGVAELIRGASVSFAEEDKAHIRISGRGELLDRFAMNLKFKGTAEFIQQDNESTISSVENRSCDIGIIHRIVDSHDLIVRPLLQDNFRLVFPKKKLRQFPSSKAEQRKVLISAPCLLYKSNDSVISNSLRHWDLTTADLNISRIYSNYAAIASMIKNGVGWAILPSHIDFSRSENHFVDLKGPDFVRNFYMCYRKELSKVEWFKKLLIDIQSIK
jgi:DNA-binding transcriptional LysR family regulator